MFIENPGAIVTLTEKLNLYEFMMAILPVHYTFFVLATIAVGCSYNNLTNLLLVESYYFSSQIIYYTNAKGIYLCFATFHLY